MKLDAIRKKIDLIDTEILAFLARRFNLAKEIKEIKNELDLPIEDMTREKELVKRLIQKAGKISLDERFITKLFDLIICESKRIQKEQT